VKGFKLCVAGVSTLALVLAGAPLAAVGATSSAPSPTVSGPAGSAVSPVLSDVPNSSSSEKIHRKEVAPKRTGTQRPKPGGGGGTADVALQTTATTALGTTDGLAFQGVGVGFGGYTDCCAPPDTNLSVGDATSNQLVEWVNLDFAVFNKTTGALIAGPKPGNSVFANLSAGKCNTNNDGDPIVKFDHLHGRWIMTQFSVTGGPPYYQCIAVSQTSDALGAYNTYAYSFGSNFNDYPKLGVFPDAYYMSFNLFANGRTFVGADACAFDSAAMIAGAASPSMVCFQQSSGGLLPADQDGINAPPAGSGGYFMNFGTNSLNFNQLHFNASAPSTSTYTASPEIPVAAFAQACNGRACVAQPATSQQLDSLGDRLMYRLAYRNDGTSQHLVVTHSVTGSGTAAPRWYELTAASGSTTYGVHQQGSYAPSADYRWMGSAAMDRLGDLAVGYSESSSGRYPSISYTGRQPGDPAGQLRQERQIKAGTGSQLSNLARWGDYSSLALDPVDDCTFWYANEYLISSGTFNWSTWIASFKFPGC